MKKYLFLLLIIFVSFINRDAEDASWIRINLLGYKPSSVKVAVWCTKDVGQPSAFELVDAITGKVVLKSSKVQRYGSYGPFTNTARLDFSSYKKPGHYYLRTGTVKSEQFKIGEDVYKGAADFCLRYMRQQRSGFNPFLKDSCHTYDGYTMYGPMPDSTHIDVVGGWHDASDYLQYVTTSANATYHLLAAYRDFPRAFKDAHQANGLEGSNNVPDVVDEAKWGLDWLLKMHPADTLMFNQLGDDRDHMGMRIPKQDTNFYGKGFERPVYFCTGEPQGLGRFKNRSTGVASTAAKFSSAFALGSVIFDSTHPEFARQLLRKSGTALNFASRKPGVCQTAPNRAPYFYEEDNWVDDMELAFALRVKTKLLPENFWKKDLRHIAFQYAKREPVTPWLGNDTAKHYQWYPFINMGHYELGKMLGGKQKREISGFYKQGIRRVYNKARENAFYRGIPFIWCSNNLTTSFAIQCYFYKKLTGNREYDALAQANFDWLFGCNPWGSSFVYGLPAHADTPEDPHSAFTHLKNYRIDGGLVDGPVSGSIYNNLIGITLYKPDEYAAFQSRLAVYHDDYGDYSTNEPTMDGTAALIYLLAAMETEM
jgi:hypothetical protein